MSANLLTFVERLGWLLVHSCWQFTLLAACAACLTAGLRRHTATLRYNLLSALLLLVALAPIATWISISQLSAPPRSRTVAAESASPAGELEVGTANRLVEAELTPDVFLAPRGKELPHAGDLAVEPDSAYDSWWNAAAQRLQPWLPTIDGVWLIGVLAFSLRPVTGWLAVRRLRTRGVLPVDDAMVRSVDRLKQLLQLRRPVEILLSNSLRSPVVVGCLRSVVLLPLGLATSLPTGQLEALLAHELAHVRRYDYLVNLLQTFLETVFFYHPAVWWLSNRLRIERENCCDDLVVAAMGDRREYGRALLAVEEFRGSTATMALAARGGSLLARVRRLARNSEDDMQQRPGNALHLLLLGMVTIAIFAGWTITRSGMAAEPDFGPESHGLRCRLIALSPEVDDESPDLNRTVDHFHDSDQMTFAVELKNVGEEVLQLAGPRYGNSYSEAIRGKLNADFFAPHMFEFVFTLPDGTPVRRTQREFLSTGLVIHGVYIHELGPQQTLRVILRPGKFQAPMEYGLSPGTYQVMVRYLGPSKQALENVRKSWPNAPLLQTWSHQVDSKPITIKIDDKSHRADPDKLVWGEAVEGLQAAIEYRVPDGVDGDPWTSPGVPVGTPLGVTFHVRNVSDHDITFVSETARQGDTVEVIDQQGNRVDVKDVWLSGFPIDVAWKLRPGDEAELIVLSPAINSIDQPGKFSIQYTIRFSSRKMTDAEGNNIFPREGDYVDSLETGVTELFYYAPEQEVGIHGEIRGRLVDESGQPIRGALVACGAVYHEKGRGGGTNARTDSQGNYRLQVPSPGIYNVWLKEYSSSSMTAAADDGIQVEAGKIATSSLVLVRGQVVSGKVVDEKGDAVPYVVVSCYSPARPESGGVQSVRADKDGSFSFRLPPGRAHLYSYRRDQQAGDRLLSADAVIDVNSETSKQPLTLVLGTSKSRFGSDQWLRRSSPGTEILEHKSQADVTGIVVNEEGEPLSGARVFKVDGPLVTSDDQGRFRVKVDEGNQFVMHVFQPGYHIWFGTPTAGDELKIVMEPKSATTRAHNKGELDNGALDNGALDNGEQSQRFPSQPDGDAPSEESRPEDNPTRDGASQENSDSAEASRPWKAIGRVTDEHGEPLSGVTVRAATGVGTLLGGASTVTDDEGRYQLSFGMGVVMAAGDDGQPSAQTQYALISARLDGHFERNFNRQGNGIASLREVPVEEIAQWGVQPEQVCLPGKPREVNFVMLPAARVAGRLIDEAEQPLVGYSVSLTGDQLPPGSSVLAQARTDEQGRFEITDIPTSAPFQFAVRKPNPRPPWDDSWASAPMTFLDPGDGDLAVRQQTSQVKLDRLASKTFNLKLVGPGVHGKLAVSRAARRDLFLAATKDALSASLVQVGEFTLVLDNTEHPTED